MEKTEHFEGTIWKLGDKKFFVRDVNWQTLQDKRERQYIQRVHIEPEIKMLQRALTKYPENTHFYFSNETMEFEPNAVHEWDDQVI